MLKIIFALCFSLFVGTITGFAQKNGDSCSSIKYEDKNQIKPSALIVKKVIGQVFDSPPNLKQEPLSSVCIALFEEKTKKLVAVMSPDEEGKFKFKKRILNGHFRLVVKHFYNGFCVANIPLEINKKDVNSKKIAVYMRPSSIDECSYGELM
jgi:hypothetical protein